MKPLKHLYKNYRENGGEKNYIEFISFLNLIDFVTLENNKTSSMLDAYVEGIKKAIKLLPTENNKSEE